jgi:negative regulator of sigma-B (phosphoserine phosphatase)
MSPESLDDLIDVGVAHRVLAGERESGDAWVLAPYDGGMLIAVIDGLGHGPEAAHAAQLARGALHDEPRADVAALIHECHTALRHSRGAVMTLVQIDLPGPTMTWIGVGNVDGRLVRGHGSQERASRANEAVLLMGGVVGYQLPVLKPVTLALHPGDTLMLATDGLRPDALEALSRHTAGVQEQADTLLSTHGRDTDDALVLIACYQDKPDDPTELGSSSV